MRYDRIMRRLLLVALALFAWACGGGGGPIDAGVDARADGAMGAPSDGAMDAPSDGGLCSASGANPLARGCRCLDAGGVMTIGCSTTTLECFAYTSDCIDDGFEICIRGVGDPLLTLCEEFCAAHGDEPWAGGCARLR